MHMNSIPSDSIPYELKALALATRYQQWVASTIAPFLGKRVLELGAGIGNMSRWLAETTELLVLTECHEELMLILKTQINAAFPNDPRFIIRSLDLESDSFSQFKDDHLDTIISFNVLEHIENDLQVLQNCATLLQQSKTLEKKRIITFVPAHQWAYGAMDKHLGHYRRYNKKRFLALNQKMHPSAKLILQPFNFVGLWGWVLNGQLLRRSSAGTGMIRIFESLCPIIKKIDSILLQKLQLPLGQSLIAIQEFD